MGWVADTNIRIVLVLLRSIGGYEYAESQKKTSLKEALKRRN